MNELIKSLAEQAALSYTQNFNWEYLQQIDKDIFEKFAELIVCECIGQGNVLAKHYIDTHPEQEQVMLLASIADYSNAIKLHFGVE